MITNQGFILVQHENPETGEVTMIPFFPYVLNSSIICEDPIMIDEHLHLTSFHVTMGILPKMKQVNLLVHRI